MGTLVCPQGKQSPQIPPGKAECAKRCQDRSSLLEQDDQRANLLGDRCGNAYRAAPKAKGAKTILRKTMWRQMNYGKATTLRAECGLLVPKMILNRRKHWSASRKTRTAFGCEKLGFDGALDPAEAFLRLQDSALPATGLLKGNRANIRKNRLNLMSSCFQENTSCG